MFTEELWQMIKDNVFLCGWRLFSSTSVDNIVFQKKLNTLSTLIQDPEHLA